MSTTYEGAEDLARMCRLYVEAWETLKADRQEGYNQQRFEDVAFSLWAANHKLRRSMKAWRDDRIDDPAPDEHENMAEWWRLLPTWLTERMGNDVWFFGLLLSTGQCLAVESICGVSQAADGSVWLTVWMVDGSWKPYQQIAGTTLVTSPTSRTTASVNVSHIVAAMELADT
jgi:hypothetical protein